MWTAHFFQAVAFESTSHIGVHKLMWKAEKLGPGVHIIASSALRIELTEELGILTGIPHAQQLKTMREAVQLKRGEMPSMLNEFLVLIQV